MEELAELIAALERTDGPDRELDGAIWEAMGFVDEAHCRSWCRMDGRTDLTRGDYIAAWAPEFTASLDAALPLVPNGYWSIDSENGKCSATVILNGEDVVRAIARSAGRFATPAIALCIAALRARSTQP